MDELSIAIAQNFAYTQKISNLMSVGSIDLNHPYWKAYKKQKYDRVIGYRGVVLYAEIPAHAALDMSQAGYTAEAEIVLPPGDYQVKYYDYLTYDDKYKG